MGSKPWQSGGSQDATSRRTRRISQGRHAAFLAALREQRPDITPEPEGWDGQRGRQMFDLPNTAPTPAQVEAWLHKLGPDNPSLREIGRRMEIDHATVKEHLVQAIGLDDIDGARERLLDGMRDRAALRFVLAVWGNPQVRRGGG